MEMRLIYSVIVIFFVIFMGMFVIFAPIYFLMLRSNFKKIKAQLSAIEKKVRKE